MATFAKLASGEWGVRVEGDWREGDWIDVARRDGETRRVRLGPCVGRFRSGALFVIGEGRREHRAGPGAEAPPRPLTSSNVRAPFESLRRVEVEVVREPADMVAALLRDAEARGVTDPPIAAPESPANRFADAQAAWGQIMARIRAEVAQ